jgi:hypothetical protein
MAINKASADARMTEVPAALNAALTIGQSQGTRTLLSWSGDRYDTVQVRVYVPASLVGKVNGFAVDYDDELIAASSATDDNTQRKQLVTRTVFGWHEGEKGGKGSLQPIELDGDGNIADDPSSAMLVVINQPDWAEISSVALSL